MRTSISLVRVLIIYFVTQAHEPALQWKGAVAEIQIASGGISFSAGTSTFPEDGRDMDTLFEIADRRLYLAKEAGRNRVYDWRNEI